LEIFLDAGFWRSYLDNVTRSGGARKAMRLARSEVQESLFEAVEEGVGALLGHTVHLISYKVSIRKLASRLTRGLMPRAIWRRTGSPMYSRVTHQGAPVELTTQSALT
jgi:hypothetical protein